MQKRLYILLMISVIVFFICAVNFEFFFSATDNSTQNSTAKPYSCANYKEVVLMRDSVAIVIRTAIPFLIIVASNAMLLGALFTTKFHKREGASSQYQIEYSFMLSTIALGFFFILVLAPLAVTLILLNVYSMVPSWASPTLLAAARVSYLIKFYI